MNDAQLKSKLAQERSVNQKRYGISETDSERKEKLEIEIQTNFNIIMIKYISYINFSKENTCSMILRNNLDLVYFFSAKGIELIGD